MKILLTGATGFLGFRTLERLITVQDITSIIATGRTILPERKIIHSKVQYKLGNLEKAEFADELVKDVDCIINAAALSSQWGRREDFFKANIITQNNLVKAAKKYNIQKFIYISTPSLYFTGKSRILVKESDPLPKYFINQYAKTKREAEIILEISKIPYIMLRPRALIGRGDTIIMPRLIRAFDEGKLKIIGNGNNIVDLTSVENVADAIILSIYATQNAMNEIYNITNDEPVNLWDNINDVLTALGKQLNTKKIPTFVAKSLAQILELKSKLTDYKEPALTNYSIGTLTQSFTLDISKAKRLLNYIPRISTQQSMNEFVNWYKNNERT